MRRFYCRNAKCARPTFAEGLPELVAPHARRTCRLAAAQARVGVALGGEAGSRLLHRLVMPASPDTALRLVCKLALPDPEPPCVVGVDDWAIRKRCTCGTVVVDLERRRVLDLLPDRTAESLAGWLREHPTIEAVARDRSRQYARGISLGAAKASRSPTAGTCWPTWARRSSAGCTPPRPGFGACRSFPPVALRRRPAATGRSRAAPLNGPPASSAAPGGRPATPRSSAGPWRRPLAGETLLGIAREMGLAWDGAQIRPCRNLPGADPARPRSQHTRSLSGPPGATLG